MEIYVAGFMFNHTKSEVLLIKKERPRWQKGKYNGIGGRAKFAESARESMIREFKEEADLITKAEDWTERVTMFVKNKNDIITAQVTFLSAIGLIEKCHTVTDETLEIVKVDEISTLNIVPNLKWLIPICLDNQLDLPVVVTIYGD